MALKIPNQDDRCACLKLKILRIIRPVVVLLADSQGQKAHFHLSPIFALLWWCWIDDKKWPKKDLPDFIFCYLVDS